mgnify:CR=1 FL=1
MGDGGQRIGGNHGKGQKWGGIHAGRQKLSWTVERSSMLSYMPLKWFVLVAMASRNAIPEMAQNQRSIFLLLSFKFLKNRFFQRYDRQLGRPAFFSPWLYRPCYLSTRRVPN